MFDNTSPGSLRKEIRSHELILTLRRRFLWIVLGCLVAFAITFWYSGRFFQYESRVFVDVSPAPVFLNAQDVGRAPTDIFRNSEYVMRVLQFTHSNRMTDHLINKFDLYKRYRIDPASPYAYVRISNAINGNISARRSPLDNVVITVRDSDRDFAASMANEIAAETDLIARDYYSKVVSGRLFYFEELHKNLSADFKLKKDGIDSALKAISTLKSESGKKVDSNTKLAEAENALMANSVQMNDIIGQLNELQKSQIWVRSLMQSKQISFVMVTQKALPDQSKFFVRRLLLSLAAMATAGFLSVLFVYYLKTYRRYFQLFFGR